MNLRRASKVTVVTWISILAMSCSSDGGSGTDGYVTDTPASEAATSELATTEMASLSSALEVPCSAPSEIVINEVLFEDAFNPEHIVQLGYIEIHNPGATTVDIQGWKLWVQFDPDGPFDARQLLGEGVIDFSQEVASGGYALLCSPDYPLPECDATLPDSVNCKNAYLPGSDNHFAVRLLSPSDVEIDRTALFDLGNPSGPNVGSGLSLVDPYLDNADDGNWTASTTVIGSGPQTGTPDAKNLDVWIDYAHPDCADGNPVSDDSCEAGFCVNSKPCSSNTDCLDENPCNTDLCHFGACQHLAGHDSDCCWAPGENPSGGPWTEQHKQAYADAQCDDGNACTDPDSCDLPNNQCQPGPAVGGCCNLNSDCDDGDPCTGDYCSHHVCLNNLTPGCCDEDSDCDDSDPCTLNRCIAKNCQFLFDPATCCSSDADCIGMDDKNDCTAEQCVLDPATGLRQCANVLIPDCVVRLPYLQDFDSVTTYDDMGWTFMDYGTPAASHWLLDTSGPLGPDRHVKFAWNPTTTGVKSVAVTPKIDATGSGLDKWNTQQQTTLQWRMSYTHNPNAAAVTLKVVASGTGDFENGEVLWTATVTGDIEYGLYSVTIPDTLKFDGALQIGFFVDADSTFSMDSWLIDDIVLASGVSNELTRARWYRCTHESCSVTTKDLKAAGEGYIPEITMTVGEHYQLELCYRDLDGTSNTWNYYGYPNAFSAGAPLDDPAFMKGASVNPFSSCMTLETTAKAICGADTRYYCTMDVDPEGNLDNAGFYRVGITTQDEYHPDKPHHSPFQSTYKGTVNVLIDQGYIIWSPLGLTHPSATAIKAAIEANGKVAQIVDDLFMVEDLSPYDGVFAVLGVYGNRHVVTFAESQKLAAFLDAGGRLYLEGGDFFKHDPAGQPQTALHAYFQIEGLADGANKLDGPVLGVNFNDGKAYDYDQGPQLNAFIDELAHVAGSGAREVLHNGGAQTFALAVAHDSGVYRTIGSSALFGGFAGQGGGATVDELMDRYLYFLENGWPPCSGDGECDDFEVCTADTCNAGACVNADQQYLEDPGTGNQCCSQGAPVDSGTKALSILCLDGELYDCNDQLTPDVVEENKVSCDQVGTAYCRPDDTWGAEDPSCGPVCYVPNCDTCSDPYTCTDCSPGYFLGAIDSVLATKLVAPDGAAWDYFGVSVAVDGDTAVIGAYQSDPGGVSMAGAAYVFTRSGSTWTQQAKLVASDAAYGDFFGYSVSISGDTVLVGAYGRATQTGTAYVFTRSGTTWTQQAKLDASDGGSYRQFGYAVSLSGDTALIGANFGSNSGTSWTGAAYAFTRSGTTWTEQAKLNAADAAAQDNFGYSVSLSGNTAVIGAYKEAPGGKTEAGSAYVFTRTGSTWTQKGKLVASDATAYDHFGWSVAATADTAVVGAVEADPGGHWSAGAAYVFTDSGGTWTQQAKLSPPDKKNFDWFGSSMSMSGNTLVVGARTADSGSTGDTGAAYVYTGSGATWTEDARLTAADGAGLDAFGVSVSVSGSIAIIGAYHADPGALADSGAAYAASLKPACEACEENCVDCTDGTTCTVCPDGFVLDADDCVADDSNWDFEAWTGADPDSLEDWLLPAGTWNITREDTFVNTGAHSARITATETGAKDMDTAWQWTGVPTDGTVLTSHLWVMDQAAGGAGASAGLRCEDAAGAAVSADYSPYSAGSGTWSELTASGTCPVGTDHLIGRVQTKSDGSASDVLVDDFAITYPMTFLPYDGNLESWSGVKPTAPKRLANSPMNVWMSVNDAGELYAATDMAPTWGVDDHMLFVWVGSIDVVGTVAMPWAKFGTVAAAGPGSALFVLIQEKSNGYCEWLKWDGGAGWSKISNQCSAGAILEGTVPLVSEMGLASAADVPPVLWYTAIHIGDMDGGGINPSYQTPASLNIDGHIDALEALMSGVHRAELLVGNVQ